MEKKTSLHTERIHNTVATRLLGENHLNFHGQRIHFLKLKYPNYSLKLRNNRYLVQ